MAIISFVWGAIMYVVGTYASFFGGSIKLVPIMVVGFLIFFVGLHLYERRYWTNIVIDQGLTQLNQELYDALMRHKEMEEEVGEKLKAVLDELTYAPLKLLLMNITLDTEKHAKLLKDIIDTLSHEQRVPSRKDFEKEVERVREVLEKHVEIEEAMGAVASEVMNKANSRVLNKLFKTLRDDEIAHHTMFDMVLRSYGSG